MLRDIFTGLLSLPDNLVVLAQRVAAKFPVCRQAFVTMGVFEEWDEKIAAKLQTRKETFKLEDLLAI